MNKYQKDEVFEKTLNIPNKNFQTCRTVRDSLSRSKNRENGGGIRYRRKENSVILWRIAKHVWNHSNMVMYVCRVIPIYPESNNWFKYCKYSNSSSFITYWNQEEGIRNLVERLRCWIKILPLKKSWFWGDEVFIACIVYVPNLALRVYHTF